jgi:hypothetical protein
LIFSFIIEGLKAKEAATMSLVEQLARLTAQRGAYEQKTEVVNQLKDLEEVEATLKEIGVTLEPRFDISLTARIGAVSGSGRKTSPE